MCKKIKQIRVLLLRRLELGDTLVPAADVVAAPSER